MDGASAGVESRRVALEVLARIEDDGAFANLVLSSMLDRSGLSGEDRGLVTDLVYGTLRRRRGIDHLIDRFLTTEPPASARRVLRVGTYQLIHRADIPDYAAVSTTVAAAPKRFRGLANAVLRKVAAAPVDYPDTATELSYPDWIVELLRADLGTEEADAALRAMNEPAHPTVRSDGYTQDLGSQWVAELVGARPGELIIDLCAAPGGKSTAMAASGAEVVAADLQESRAGLIRSNVEALGSTGVIVAVADGLRPPFRHGVADRVLLDAPCSGLGVLRRRADARWRLTPDVVERLSLLQKRLFDAAVPLVRPGGVLVYSVCTLSRAETTGVDAHAGHAWPHLESIEAPGGPWRPSGRGGLLLPQVAGTDGMFVARYRVPDDRAASSPAS
uniref:Ribosomal RNA small subunit methyltransferase B n=1 Tax=uncultured bacterium A1Q1_fos_862 TaxID=1256590 RepID=L7VTR8_9BACT|nr:ribosomal RNA small subunit methyltransferase B [uncultured bacterium A1Q1_fos_862]